MDKFNNIQLELELEENNNETDDTANNAIQEIMNNFANVQPFVNTYLRRSSAGSTFSPADLDEEVLAKS